MAQLQVVPHQGVDLAGRQLLGPGPDAVQGHHRDFLPRSAGVEFLQQRLADGAAAHPHPQAAQVGWGLDRAAGLVLDLPGHVHGEIAHQQRCRDDPYQIGQDHDAVAAGGAHDRVAARTGGQHLEHLAAVAQGASPADRSRMGAGLQAQGEPGEHRDRQQVAAQQLQQRRRQQGAQEGASQIQPALHHHHRQAILLEGEAEPVALQAVRRDVDAAHRHIQPSFAAGLQHLPHRRPLGDDIGQVLERGHLVPEIDGQAPPHPRLAVAAGRRAIHQAHPQHRCRCCLASCRHRQTKSKAGSQGQAPDEAFHPTPWSDSGPPSVSCIAQEEAG